MLIPEPGLTEFDTVVRKQKFDGSVRSEWEGNLLPLPVEDWLIVVHHPEQHRKISGKTVEYSEPLFLHCFSINQPLTVLMGYDLSGQLSGAKCDAALPATQEDSVIEFVDLDLDLIVEPDLSHSVRDETVFARNRETMGYPATVVQQARQGISLARTLVASRQFPFDDRTVPRLNAAVMSLINASVYS